MANTIPSQLQVDEIMGFALEELKYQLLPFKRLGAVFNNVPLKGTNKMLIPYYPLAVSTTATRAEGVAYSSIVTDTVTSYKEITINTSAVQGVGFTQEEAARQPAFDPARHGRLKAQKLLKDVFASIFSVVTAANFPGTTIAATTAANFDESDVNDLMVLCDNANWPEEDRALLLSSAYYGNLLKQPQIIDNSKNPSNGSNFRDGVVRDVLGFDTTKVYNMPENSTEKIVGAALLPGAILMGFSPVPPTDAIREQMHDYQILTDKDTGIALEYRVFANPDTAKEYRIFEIHYGFAVGDSTQLKRIVKP